VLYGRNAVAEALRGRRQLKSLLLATGIKDDDRIRQLISAANERSVPISYVPRVELGQRTDFANHQGVVLLASGYRYSSIDDIFSNSGTVLALDHLQDPQNFGTLLRAAEATGVSGVVIPKDRAVEVTPAVVNSSAGAVEHLRIVQVPNLARTIETAKSAGWWAAGLDTGVDSVDLYTTTIPRPLMVIVGAEGAGLGQNVRRHCDLILSIPMVGVVGSLNASTAGSIALFEIFRRAR
jgi:23S rRNA (guanosine2251-2'-O)-methyltransferase